MERVSIDDPDRRMGPAADKRALSGALGTTDLALNYYELAPGDAFGFGYHRHPRQEEVFYVVEGTATFEHREPRSGSSDSGGAGADGEKTEVGAGEVVRFEPGEFQCGRNESDDTVTALALAAPGRRHNWEDLESFAPCGECGEVTSHGVREPDEAFVIYCNECENEIRIG